MHRLTQQAPETITHILLDLLPVLSLKCRDLWRTYQPGHAYIPDQFIVVGHDSLSYSRVNPPLISPPQCVVPFLFVLGGEGKEGHKYFEENLAHGHHIFATY